MSTSHHAGMSARLWFIPVLCVLGGLLLSVMTLAVDRARGFDVIPRWLTGGPDAALGILSTIALSMVSLATLVLTITMVVVQLAMGQFSPRIVQTFLRDRPSQLAIGLFVATFAHAMVAMREVHFEGEGRVPGIAIAVAYLLVLTSIAMLVLYVNHIGRSLRVSALIELVGTDTRRLLDEHYPDVMTKGSENDPDVVVAPTSGVLVSIDHDRLVELATVADCVLHVVPPVGAFVPSGCALLRVEGQSSRLDRDAALDALGSSLERTLEEDVAYGFRMLVDMAERALSDSPFLDPTTAVQALDRLHDGMRQLAVRAIPDGNWRDEAGHLRLTDPGDGLGRLRAPGVRGDPHRRGAVAAGHPASDRGTERPALGRSTRTSRTARRAAPVTAPGTRSRSRRRPADVRTRARRPGHRRRRRRRCGGPIFTPAPAGRPGRSSQDRLFSLNVRRASSPPPTR